MSIGGIDVVLLAPSDECVADTILRACRRHWPNSSCQFQAAHREETASFADEWVWMVGTSLTEFSVYRDADAVASWRKNGAMKENANSMFHFILGEASVQSGLIEVAMIYDKNTKELQSFVSDLQDAFLSMASSLISERRAA